MAVYLARSECRDGYWNVVTYDISNPDAWQELGSVPTPQACSESLQVAFQASAAEPDREAERRHVAAHVGQLERPGTALLISSRGHSVALTHEDDLTFLRHCDDTRAALETTCSGYCKSADGTIVTVGPQSCPSGNGGIDCTSKPPRLICT